MHKLIFLLIATIIIASCNSNQTSSTTAAATDSTDTASAVENHVMIPTSRCYSSTKNKDTIFLKLEKFPNVVTGILKYNLYEKDKNNGDIDGTMHGDTLIADYRFMSEGKQSVRQVAFLVNDSSVTEGYGEMEEKDGKMIFKNTGAINFSGTQLTEIACPLE